MTFQKPIRDLDVPCRTLEDLKRGKNALDFLEYLLDESLLRAAVLEFHAVYTPAADPDEDWIKLEVGIARAEIIRFWVNTIGTALETWGSPLKLDDLELDYEDLLDHIAVTDDGLAGLLSSFYSVLKYAVTVQRRVDLPDDVYITLVDGNLTVNVTLSDDP